MQVNIATRHGHLSEKSQAKINEKVGRLTRFHDKLAAAQVTVDLANEERPSVEVNITADRAGPFVASEQADQLMAALDSVVRKLEQQLRKHKEKVADRQRTARRTVVEPSDDE